MMRLIHYGMQIIIIIVRCLNASIFTKKSKCSNDVSQNLGPARVRAHQAKVIFIDEHFTAFFSLSPTMYSKIEMNQRRQIIHRQPHRIHKNSE